MHKQGITFVSFGFCESPNKGLKKYSWKDPSKKQKPKSFSDLGFLYKRQEILWEFYATQVQAINVYQRNFGIITAINRFYKLIGHNARSSWGKVNTIQRE